jgi:hypothetical protein
VAGGAAERPGGSGDSAGLLPDIPQIINTAGARPDQEASP